MLSISTPDPRSKLSVNGYGYDKRLPKGDKHPPSEPSHAPPIPIEKLSLDGYVYIKKLPKGDIILPSDLCCPPPLHSPTNKLCVKGYGYDKRLPKGDKHPLSEPSNLPLPSTEIMCRLVYRGLCRS